MTTALPLLKASGADAVVARRDGRAVSAGAFLSAAGELARRLPPGAAVLNLCVDRLAFSLGLAAALIARRTSLLPASTAPVALARLAGTAGPVVCLSDSRKPPTAAPHLRVDADIAAAPAHPGVRFEVPSIPVGFVAARVHTSGSTGEPVGHDKRWGALCACLAAGARALGIDDGGFNVVATVPSQHMYGLELGVLMPLLTGNASCAATPLHASEVAAALESVPAPRVLATTPVHLRALLASGIAFPAVDLLVSATAPLSAALAREGEARFRAPLREIYGSTETGQIASRRTARDEDFVPWPGIRLERDAPARGSERWLASGGHLDAPTSLQDEIEPRDAGAFRLLGRCGDVVNIAGRRSSLAYLNHALLDIPGVVDGCFVAPDPDDAGDDGRVTRLAALAVAPRLSAAEVLSALRLRIDPAFLPRPLLLVDALPRNATGKLPRDTVRALLSTAETAAAGPS